MTTLPRSIDRIAACHADIPSGRKLPRVALDATEGALPGTCLFLRLLCGVLVMS
jgi:hypothetical protein